MEKSQNIITTKFKVGDKVWVANAKHKSIWKQCPVCFGKKVVTIILGDDTYVETPCEYCEKGVESSTGVIETVEWIEEAFQTIISEIDIKQTEDIIEYEYFRFISLDCRQNITGQIFLTQEEALVRAKEMTTKYNKKEFERLLRPKEYKSYTWHVGYHLRNAKQHHKDAEYHERMAKICKERARVVIDTTQTPPIMENLK